MAYLTNVCPNIISDEVPASFFAIIYGAPNG